MAYLENRQGGTTSQEGAIDFGERRFFLLRRPIFHLFFNNLIFIPKGGLFTKVKYKKQYHFLVLISFSYLHRIFTCFRFDD